MESKRCLTWYYLWNSNNSCEISLLECVEKEHFKFENLEDKPMETESEFGKEAQFLQSRTITRLQECRQ